MSGSDLVAGVGRVLYGPVRNLGFFLHNRGVPSTLDGILREVRAPWGMSDPHRMVNIILRP